MSRTRFVPSQDDDFQITIIGTPCVHRLVLEQMLRCLPHVAIKVFQHIDQGHKIARSHCGKSLVLILPDRVVTAKIIVDLCKRSHLPAYVIDLPDISVSYYIEAIRLGVEGIFNWPVDLEEIRTALAFRKEKSAFLSPRVAFALMRRIRDDTSSIERKWELLSKREQSVAAQIAMGKSNKEIASALGISERTVESHLCHIYAKGGFHSRTEAAVMLAKEGSVFAQNPVSGFKL